MRVGDKVTWKTRTYEPEKTGKITHYYAPTEKVIVEQNYPKKPIQ